MSKAETIWPKFKCLKTKHPTFNEAYDSNTISKFPYPEREIDGFTIVYCTICIKKYSSAS